MAEVATEGLVDGVELGMGGGGERRGFKVVEGVGEDVVRVEKEEGVSLNGGGGEKGKGDGGEEEEEEEEEDDEDEEEEDDDEDDVELVIDGPGLSSGVSFLQGPIAFPGTKRWNKLSFPSSGGANGVGGQVGAAANRSQGIVSLLPNPTMNVPSNQKSVYDLEISKLAEKPWRERGADLSDYFNYGFTEDTWKVYCERQVQMRLEASMLAKIKTVDGGNKPVVKEKAPEKSKQFEPAMYPYPPSFQQSHAPVSKKMERKPSDDVVVLTSTENTDARPEHPNRVDGGDTRANREEEMGKLVMRDLPAQLPPQFGMPPPQFNPGGMPFPGGVPFPPFGVNGPPPGAFFPPSGGPPPGFNPMGYPGVPPLGTQTSTPDKDENRSTRRRPSEDERRNSRRPEWEERESSRNPAHPAERRRGSRDDVSSHRDRDRAERSSDRDRFERERPSREYTRESRDSRDTREPRDSRESRESREPSKSREARESRQPRRSDDRRRGRDEERDKRRHSYDRDYEDERSSKRRR